MNDYLEPDYTANNRPVFGTSFLPNSSIEIIAPPEKDGGYEHVLFDFDGTLSLIREGWPDVMIPMMVEQLRTTGTSESTADLQDLVTEFVMELTGKQTIYQMIRLSEEIKKRGGHPRDPADYKSDYHERLMRRIQSRRDDLASGRVAPAEMVVPGSFDLLDDLVARGVSLYLASGTDESYVREEVALLGLDAYFEDRVYGAKDDYKSFSKALVIARILTENSVDGDKLLGFGDGYVEIQNVKGVGGTAVGVASDEARRDGRPDPWKRTRLISVGADLIVPDFREARRLNEYLWVEHLSD
jgi:phosphoglycolate phosphatase-like HAD superfamily hydrolase